MTLLRLTYVVVEEEREQANDHDNSSGATSSLGVDSRARCPHDIRHEHANTAPCEQGAPTEAVNEESRTQGCPKIEDLKQAIDQSLHERVRNSHGVEYQRQVVAHDSNAVPLGECPETNDDEEPLSVALSSDQCAPACSLRLLLFLYGIVDLSHLAEHKRAGAVSRCMVSCENVEGFLGPIICDEPSRRLRNPIISDELHRRESCLQDRGYSPAPVRLHWLRSEGGPTCKDCACFDVSQGFSSGMWNLITKIVHRPKRRRVSSSMDRICKLCDEHGSWLDDQHAGGTYDEPRNDKLSVRGRSCLNDRCYDHAQYAA